MKLKKRLIGAGLTLAAAVLLTACGKSASDNGEMVMMATSPDFKVWTKNHTFRLKGSDYGYSRDDFRDPFVFKGLELQNDIVTAKEYEEALKKWQKEKIETNAKYQKELANHVK